MAKFFFLTYAVSWACWIPAVAVSQGTASAISGIAALRWMLLLAGTFGPAIVALLLTSRADGKPGLRALLGRLFHWRVALRWYLFAILYMPVVKLAAATTHRLTTSSWPRFGHEGPLVIAIAVVVSTPMQAGEEIGWRGYALPRLAARLGWVPAAALLGVIWGVWHLPLFFLPGADKYGQSLPIYVIGVVALSIALTYLYAHTSGSLLLVMLMHSAFNQTIGIVSDILAPGEKPFALGASLPFLLTIAYMWLIAAWCIWRMPKARQPIVEIAPTGTEITTASPS